MVAELPQRYSFIRLLLSHLLDVELLQFLTIQFWEELVRIHDQEICSYICVDVAGLEVCSKVVQQFCVVQLIDLHQILVKGC